MNKQTTVGNASNEGSTAIGFTEPYAVEVEVIGTSPYLYHRWSVDGVEAKSKAAKGSKAKKEDDLESYVYRDESGDLCIPSEYFRMSCIHAAKYKQDPRSPRKSAMDLFKAGLVCLTDLNTVGKRDWDFVDRRRVMIQRNGITRHRPALNQGWKVKLVFQVLTPEYISKELLNEVVQSAGRLVGVGDFRPTFGRFQVTKFEVLV
jgi:hypothetical protein